MEKLNLSGLQELFGRAIVAKAIRNTTRLQKEIGKNPGRNKHHECRDEHPAGTKFLRRCIRRSGRESTYNRQLYALMTGHQYSGTSA